MPDQTIAPAGQHFVRCRCRSTGSSPRLTLLRAWRSSPIQALPGWRERTTHRLESLANARTGAVDFPGMSWRDRPAIDRGDGVYLVGDRVAAPGLLGEVSLNSGVRAARLALA